MWDHGRSSSVLTTAMQLLAVSVSILTSIWFHFVVGRMSAPTTYILITSIVRMAPTIISSSIGAPTLLQVATFAT